MCFRKYAHRLEISAVVRRRDPNTHSLFVSHSLVWVRETKLQIEDACPRVGVCVWVCVCVFLQRENTSLLFRLDRQGIPFWVTRVTLCGDV